MKRVAIIGSPGTGKSTFAKQLAKRTNLPLIHLDYYYHNKQHNYYKNKDAWRAKADDFTNEESWIIDGNFGATMAKRLERADTIFYFNMPTYLALLGIIKRWITANRKDRPEMPNGWQEKPSFSFFWKVFGFRYHYARGTKQLLTDNQNKKIVIFKSYRQITAYLSSPHK